MLLNLAAPADNEQGPLYMQHALEALHPALAAEEGSLCFQYGCYQDKVGLYCQFAESLAHLVQQHLYGAYPDLKLHRRAETALLASGTLPTWVVEFALRPELFPIQRYTQDDDRVNRQLADKLSRILTLLSPREELPIHSRIELTLRVANERRRQRARRIVRRLDTVYFQNRPELAERYAAAVTGSTRLKRTWGRVLGWPGRTSLSNRRIQSLTSTPAKGHEREDPLSAAMDKLSGPLFETRIRVVVSAAPELREVANAQLANLAAAITALGSPRLARLVPSPAVSSEPNNVAKKQKSFLMSPEEVATLFHPTTVSVRTHKLETNPSRQLEPPVRFPSGRGEDEVELARMNFPGRRSLVGLKQSDRRRHMVVHGKTGAGKTNFIKRMIWRDLQAGRGLCVIDPHGDLADEVIRLVPRRRTNDVVWFDVSDREFPVAFNPLDVADPNLRPLVVSEIISAVKKLSYDSWGPQLEDCLRNSLLALTEVPGATLLSLTRFLGNSRYRSRLLRSVRDQLIRDYWLEEFDLLKPSEQTLVIKSVQNKIRPFLSSPLIRRIVAQPQAKLNLRQVMDEGKILVVNLSKGKIGEDNVGFLGSLLILKLQSDALSRADQPETARRDFYLYVDEFASFAPQSFTTALSEGRKYRLNLILATQSPRDILDPVVEAKIYENVGSIVTFNLGAKGAEQMAAEMGIAHPADIVRLPKYEAFASLLDSGSRVPAFSIRSLKAPEPQQGTLKRDILRRVSRRAHARPRPEVDRMIEEVMRSV